MYSLRSASMLCQSVASVARSNFPPLKCPYSTTKWPDSDTDSLPIMSSAIARLCHHCLATFSDGFSSFEPCHTLSRPREEHNPHIPFSSTCHIQPPSCTALSPLVPTQNIVVMHITTVSTSLSLSLSPIVLQVPSKFRETDMITMITVRWHTSLLIECIPIFTSVQFHFS